MSVLLLILGIVVAAAGVVAIGFGIPLNEFTLGTTLISGGATALTGGFVLIGLSAVVAELARLADGLGKTGARSPQRSSALEPGVPAFPATPVPPPVAVPAPRQPGSAMPMPPRPRPDAPIRDVSGRDGPSRDVRPAPSHQPSPSSVDVSAAAIERLRSTIPRTESPQVEAPPAGHAEEAPLSPNGGANPYAPPGRPRPESEAPEPRVAPDERAGGAVEALKASRLDFLFRSKAARPAQQAESFESIWPADARPGRNAAAPATTSHAADQPSSAPPAQQVHPPPAPVEPSSAQDRARPAASPTILKSGVVDGMAYTLYTDGSIEAKLPEGTIRFGSVAELRAHIESSS